MHIYIYMYINREFTTHLGTIISQRRMTFCTLFLQDIFARPLSEQHWRGVPALLVKSARVNP